MDTEPTTAIAPSERKRDEQFKFTYTCSLCDCILFPFRRRHVIFFLCVALMRPYVLNFGIFILIGLHYTYSIVYWSSIFCSSYNLPSILAYLILVPVFKWPTQFPSFVKCLQHFWIIRIKSVWHCGGSFAKCSFRAAPLLSALELCAGVFAYAHKFRSRCHCNRMWNAVHLHLQFASGETSTHKPI